MDKASRGSRCNVYQDINVDLVPGYQMVKLGNDIKYGYTHNLPASDELSKFVIQESLDRELAGSSITEVPEIDPSLLISARK